MAKQIIWSRLAQSDRFSILNYWSENNQSVSYSRKLNEMFKKSIKLIAQYPNIGMKTDVENVRIKIVKEYYITYQETDSTIEILTIWDWRQDPSKLNKVIENL